MDKIYFTINGEHYRLSGSEVSPETTLSAYLRDTLQLYGTKTMCHEGGCGACVVSVAAVHAATREKRVFAVNSCLVHILSCHEWEITTIEGVSNSKGYHDIQKRLAAFNGTQCGYCTPGWVMGMYSLYKSSGGKLTTSQVERSFGGHMCRCTGYRPILDAFKTFATDTEPIQDMEDLHKLGCLNRLRPLQALAEAEADDWCLIENTGNTGEPLLLELGPSDSRWYKAYTVQDIFKILAKEGVDSYRLVAGNTGKGVFPITVEPRVLVDISSVASLQECVKDENLVVGAGTSLAAAAEEFSRWASAKEEFRYLAALHDHLLLVAHEAVRNIGTLGGNLAMKNANPEFPSDVYVMLATVGATITIMDSSLNKKEVSMLDFLKEQLTNKLIVNVKLPPLAQTSLVRTYKVMPRAQNTHAIVNAGFLFKMDAHKVVSANVVFGSMGGNFVHARATEQALIGRELFANDSLERVLKALSDELRPDVAPPDPSPLCRRTVAMGLLYKAVLSLCPSAELSARFLSGGAPLQRAVSRGQQLYDTDRALWPLTQPLPKLAALQQCAGEVRYACDAPAQPRDVHLALVLADSIGAIQGIDGDAALKIPGVVDFFTAADIPGRNSFTPLSVPWQGEEEEILATSHARYVGQPLGVLGAASRALAEAAARAVRTRIRAGPAPPVLHVRAALAAPDRDRRVRQDIEVKRTDRGTATAHVIRGSYSVGSQYHYTMEPQSCWASAAPGRVRLRSATQWPDLVHVAVAQALGLQENQVEVEVERVGGGYGGKASRSALAACACALAALRLRRPRRAARLALPLAHNMAALGMRSPCTADYEVGVDNDGIIQYLTISYYSDCGYSFNDSSGSEIAGTLTRLYDSARWDVTGYSVLTDKPSNTWCRAPATTEATAIMEHIMERIAFVTKRDPMAVKLQHVRAEHAAVADMVTTLTNDSDYERRKAEIEQYNADNAWKKRGIGMAIMAYPIGYYGNFAVTISVYHADGSVLAAHGGVEMGQGINTKVAQVIAYSLGIPLDLVAVRGTDSFVSPNAMASNGSVTSESVAHAAIQACQLLLQRLPQGETWRDRVKQAYDSGINLQTSYMTSSLDKLEGYSVYGACALEVELDVLTGQRELRRADILEDTGRSMNPDIDVGQIEGAFVMGLGLWGLEGVSHAQSGHLLTSRTWTYFPPGARDIPADFRVSFRRRSTNTAGVLRSKATGEPALVLAVVLTHALRAAARAARVEFGHDDSQWLHIDIPYNVENILKAISPKIESFKLKQTS